MRRLLPLALFALSALPTTAQAVPPFARKYGTGCQTCHTVYPRLNPFGEAFRRRGYRFPGVDSDNVQQEPVALGQDAHRAVFPEATWPGLLPASAPLGLAVEGHALAHPDVRSSAARADQGTAFSLRDLVAEVELLAGGSFDDALTFFAAVSVNTRGEVDVERVEVRWSDLLGPPGWLNLAVGKAPPALTSFGSRSSYLASTLLPSVPVAALLGATDDGFRLGARSPGVELNGVVAERLTWSLGLAAGAMVELRPTENVWAHLGVLLGAGADGKAGDASLAVDLFGFHAVSRYTAAPGTVTQDTAQVLGGALRLQLFPVALDTGFYAQRHSRVQAASAAGHGALLLVHHDELSWTIFPWLVPALRVELLHLAPDGGPPAWNLRVIPGVAFLIRQNLKGVLSAQFETASGPLPAGWARAGAFASPTSAAPTVALENESVTLSLAAAF